MLGAVGHYLWRPLWRLFHYVAPTAPDEALHRMIWAVGGLILTMAVGVVGYGLIDGIAPFDALYQTALTLTTVGFQEVHPLSRGARAFTIFLMFFGVSIALYLLAAIATLLLEGDLYRDVGARRQRRMLDQLTGHTIIAGAGRMGSRVAESRAHAGQGVVVIEPSGAAAQRARDLGLLVIEGDAEIESVLDEAGVRRASVLLAVTGDDAMNVFITLRALQISPTLHVIARANDPASEEILHRAGAAQVVSPVDLAAQLVEAAIASHMSSR